MTPVGKNLFLVYSIFAVIILIGVNFKRLERGDDRGWDAAVLIPVLIFLVNVI